MHRSSLIPNPAQVRQMAAGRHALCPPPCRMMRLKRMLAGTDQGTREAYTCVAMSDPVTDEWVRYIHINIFRIPCGWRAAAMDDARLIVDTDGAESDPESDAGKLWNRQSRCGSAGIEGIEVGLLQTSALDHQWMTATLS